jgi:hypothetical protein
MFFKVAVLNFRCCRLPALRQRLAAASPQGLLVWLPGQKAYWQTQKSGLDMPQRQAMTQNLHI